jgi:bifunctional non-homologous end joining protein LigD
MFRRGEPFFYPFDLLWFNGEELRGLSLLERKRRLREFCLQRHGSANRLLYFDHLERNGSGLFAKACELDLEGIVAKWKSAIRSPDSNIFDVGQMSCRVTSSTAPAN